MWITNCLVDLKASVIVLLVVSQGVPVSADTLQYFQDDMASAFCPPVAGSFS